MNPLSIIGSAVGVSLVAGLVYLVPIGFSAYNTMIVESVTAKADRQHTLETTKTAEAERVKDEKQVASFKAREREHVERFNEQSKLLEARMVEDPLAVDDDIMREFFSVMCETAAGGDHGAVQTCSVRAAEADVTRDTAFVSVTPKTIADWSVVCDTTGEDAFCNYSLIAIRTAPLRELIGWLREVNTVILSQRADLDATIAQLERLAAAPDVKIE